MANQFDAAFASLRGCFQTVTGSVATVTSGAQVVQCIPGEQGLDNVFHDGGFDNAAQVTVQTRASDWATLPAKLSVVMLAGHVSAANGTYQVLMLDQREGTVTLMLGNLDTQQ